MPSNSHVSARAVVGAVLLSLVAATAASAPGPSAYVTAVSRTLPASPDFVRLAASAKPQAKARRAVGAAPAPNDPLWPVSWSLAKVRVATAWANGGNALGTLVAVLDTGVDATHPDLLGATVAGWDAVNEDADPADDHGHGTLVAGVIAARANNAVGGVGACPRCSVMPVKVIGGNGTGTGADIAEGLVWAADHGAHVINLSFVMSGYDASVAAALAYARAKGAVVVAAAGNSGSSDVTFPAGEPGVVSVTATDPDDRRFPWATFGSWVAVAAPGCSHSTALGGGYAEFCGSSSAAALASGVVGLVRWASGAVSGEEAAAALAAGAIDVGDFVAAGRLDVGNVLRAPALGRAAPADSRPGRPAPRPDLL